MCRYATAVRCVAGGVRGGESLRNAYSGRVRRRLTGRGESWSRQKAAWRSRGAGGRVCRRCAAAAYCWRLRTPATGPAARAAPLPATCVSTTRAPTTASRPERSPRLPRARLPAAAAVAVVAGPARLAFHLYRLATRL